MNLLNGFLRFLAVVILALFVLVFPLSLLARNAGQLLFSPETIKQVVKDRLLDPQFVGNLARQGSRGLLTGGAADQSAQAETAENQLVLTALGQLSEEDWTAIAALIAPPEVIGPAIDELVDTYAEWLESDQPLPLLQLDLLLIKSSLAQNAPQVTGIVLNALPECSLEDLAAQALESLTGEGAGLALCRPPEPLYTVMLGNAESMVNLILTAAPDHLDLTGVEGFEPPAELVALKENLNRTRIVLNGTWLVLCALGVAAVAMAARSFTQVLRWSGWPLLLSGLGTMVLGLGFRVVQNSLLSGSLSALIRQVSTNGSLLAAAAAGTALDIMGAMLRLQGAVMAVAGLGLLLTPVLIARFQRDPLIGTQLPRD